MTKEIRIGNVTVGGGNTPVIQSMCSTKTADTEATAAQINALASAGCRMVRVAVPDAESAKKLTAIKSKITVPLIADIHFDYRLAILSIEAGADKIRVNPGNIGFDNIKKIADCLKAHDCAVRIGCNGGSMAREEYGKYGAGAAGLTESCLRYVRNFEDSGFGRLVLSVKSSNVTETVRAYRLLSARTDYPLHIGVTEAGLYESALVKSSIGIGALLIDGIGDTLRVSVTGDPLQEVAAAKLILRAAGLDRNYCEIISCPTCARCTADLTAITEKINAYTANITRPLKLAVMGCAVNGPGEAKEADLGIAFGGGKGVIFRKGEIVSTVPERELYDAFIKEIDGLTKV